MSVTTYHSSYVGSMYADREIDADGYIKYEDYAALEARLKALEEAWRTTVGDGTDKLTPEGIRSLVDDYQEDLREMKARLKALEWRRITVEEFPENGNIVWSALHGACTGTGTYQESMQPASCWHKYEYTDFDKLSRTAEGRMKRLFVKLYLWWKGYCPKHLTEKLYGRYGGWPECPACAEEQNHLRQERIKEALKFMQD